MEFQIQVPYTLTDFIIRCVERVIAGNKFKKEGETNYAVTYNENKFNIECIINDNNDFVIVKVTDAKKMYSTMKFIPLSDTWKINGNEKTALLLYSDYDVHAEEANVLCNDIVHEVASEIRASNKQLLQLTLIYHTTEDPSTFHGLV